MGEELKIILLILVILVFSVVFNGILLIHLWRKKNDRNQR